MTTIGGKFTTKKRNLVTYIEPGLYEELRALAEDNKRSVSAEAALAINQHIANSDEETHLDGAQDRESPQKTLYIATQFEQLSSAQQDKVIEYIQRLPQNLPYKETQGMSGTDLLSFSGFIKPSDILLMNQAINIESGDEE